MAVECENAQRVSPSISAALRSGPGVEGGLPVSCLMEIVR